MLVFFQVAGAGDSFHSITAKIPRGYVLFFAASFEGALVIGVADEPFAKGFEPEWGGEPSERCGDDRSLPDLPPHPFKKNAPKSRTATVAKMGLRLMQFGAICI